MAGVPPIKPADQADFVFRVGEFDVDKLKVLRFTGREALSELYRFRIELISDEVDVSAADILGKSAELAWETAGGRRHCHGIISRFGRIGVSQHRSLYEAELVPVHWLLSRRRRSRIFQEHIANDVGDMTVPGIIKKIFSAAGIPDDRFRFALERTYEAREYVVQYRETDLDFIMRLMEEEGIFFFFEHDKTLHKMVIADSGVAHVASPLAPDVAFRDPTGLVAEDEFVFAARDREDMVYGGVALDDFDFEHPGDDLLARYKEQQPHAREFSDHPGGYIDKNVGKRLAQDLLEAIEWQKRTIELQGTVRGLLPGYTFTQTSHPQSSFNATFLVVSVDHRGEQPQSGEEEATASADPYTAIMRVIDSETPFRPPHRTPRPRTHGTQTALVCGPSGEEIYTDKYGRVKVQFYWDRDGEHNENSSRWIRVSQGAAGGGYGMMFLPRVGQEVIVDFIDGNPDDPIIVGRVYNADQMPPYTLPDEKTKSTIKTNSSKGGGGTNEIRFEDAKGSEQLLFNAERDLHLRAKRNKVSTIGGNESTQVGGTEFKKIGKDRHVEIEADDRKLIYGKHCLSVNGPLMIRSAGDTVEMANGERSLSASTIVLDASTGITLKGPGGFITIDGGGVWIKGNTVFINSGGAEIPAMNSDEFEYPDPPSSADTVSPGQDVTYNAAAEQTTPVDELETLEEQETFVEFQLLDPEGHPVPNEPFVIRKPDGSEQSGATDGEGKARVEGIDPGTAHVQFPNRHNNAWRRIRVEEAPAS